MRKDSEKNKDKNRYHREHGLLSNLAFIWKNMVGFDRMTVLTIVIAGLCSPVVAYLWTFMSKLVIDVVTNKEGLDKLFVIICITFVLQTVFTMLQSYMWAQWWRYVGARFNMIVNKNRRFMTMPYEFLEDKEAMDCYQKANQACGGNNEGVEGMMHLMEHTVTELSIVVTGLFILGTLSVAVMAGLTVIAFLTFLTRNRTNRVCKKEIWDPLATWWRKDGYLRSTFLDFNFAKDIRMYGLKDYLIRRYKKISEERIEAQKKNEIRWWICGQICNVLWVAAVIGLYAWLIWSVIYTDLSIGNFTLYLGSATTFFEFASVLFDRLTQLFARSREVDDFRSFMEIASQEECVTRKQMWAEPASDSFEFRFENVSFRYPGAEQFALRNLNITVRAGEKLAVVGLNGAGKSTFIKLLLRLYEPTEGRILLNGTDVRTYDRNDYYKLFSPVFQEVYMFAFPLKANVSMSGMFDTDEERVKECLDAAGMKDAVDGLKDGIDTEVLKVVSSEGVDFSGGEKQKIALARALYKNAPVIVLDEPTAALDALAEARLYADFDKLVSGKTAVYISHRLSSTRFCDHVAMFKDGEMVEYGTHESLLGAGGPYSEMFNVQAAYYLEKGEQDGDQEAC